MRPGEPRNPLLEDDEQLARRVAMGDDGAVALLYERHQDGLFRYCRSLLRDEDTAADAMQETFAKALVALRERRRSAPVRPWLFRIAHNESMNVLRARGRTAPPREMPDLAPAPGAQAATRAELAALLRDLERLTPRQRSALVMRELNGLSHAEIAIALSVSTNAAKQAIFEARAVLDEFAEGRALACADVRALIQAGDRRRLRSKRLRAHLAACRGCEEEARTRRPGLFVPLLWPLRRLAAAFAEHAAAAQVVRPAVVVAAIAGMAASLAAGGTTVVRRSDPPVLALPAAAPAARASEAATRRAARGPVVLGAQVVQRGRTAKPRRAVPAPAPARAERPTALPPALGVTHATAGPAPAAAGEATGDASPPPAAQSAPSPTPDAHPAPADHGHPAWNERPSAPPKADTHGPDLAHGPPAHAEDPPANGHAGDPPAKDDHAQQPPAKGQDGDAPPGERRGQDRGGSDRA